MTREFISGGQIGAGFISETGTRGFVVPGGLLSETQVTVTAVPGMKVWTGSAWVEKPVKVWNGSAWVTKPVKRWSGSAWIGGSAPPVTVYQDTFDRANANLEASAVASGGWSWVHDGLIAGGMIISSNVLSGNTTNSTGTAYKTPSVGSSNHYVQYKVPATGSSGPFCCCRLADNSNFVGIRNDSTTVEVYRRVAGTLSSIGSGVCAIGDILRLECSGTNFLVKKNGSTLIASTPIGNAGLTNVGTGIVARTTTGPKFDDFEAGAL